MNLGIDSKKDAFVGKIHPKDKYILGRMQPLNWDADVVFVKSLFQ